MEKLRLPEYEISMSISHNEHKLYYMSVEEWLADNMSENDCWVTPESRQRAIETDSVWQLQWYPKTPIGFNLLYAATLEELIGNGSN